MLCDQIVNEATALKYQVVLNKRKGGKEKEIYEKVNQLRELEKIYLEKLLFLLNTKIERRN